MSSEKLCYYAIAKYIPDLLKNEPKNIGVLLYTEGENHYRFKPVSNLKGKLGVTLHKSDRDVIKSYNNYFNDFHPENVQQIKDSINKNTGKFQFSEMRTVVTRNFESELNFLYSTFIEEPKVNEGRTPRLKTSLRNQFKTLNLIGEKKLEENKEFKGGKLEHVLDFSHQNGKLFAIEAVDLSIHDKKRSAYETAFKFEDLYYGLGRKKLQLISVVKQSIDVDRNDLDLVKALSAFSTVYNFANGQREKLIREVKKVIGY